MKLPKIGRRHFIGGLTASAAALSLAPRVLFAQAAPDHRFVSLYFNGGWDLLYGADPRRPAERQDSWSIQLPGNYFDADRDGGHGDLLPVRIGSTDTFFHPAFRDLIPHADLLTLFRGVNMNTVAHTAGRAYTNTFRPPSGAVPQGDSLGTLMAASSPWNEHVLPNVSIRMPSFNMNQDISLTGVRLGDATQSRAVLEPLGANFEGELAEMLDRAREEMSATSCVATDYLDLTPADQTAVARADLRRALESGAAEAFSFDEATRARYGVRNDNGNDPGLIAASAARFITSGLSKSVSAQIQNGLDGHQESVLNNTPTRLAAAAKAVRALLDDLRVDDPSFERTTVLLHSEFGRTPRINGTRGRDHWLANHILVFGGGLRRGVYGETKLETLERQAVNPETGLVDGSESAFVLEPKHIGATIARAAFGADGWERQDLSRVFRVDPLMNWIA